MNRDHLGKMLNLNEFEHKIILSENMSQSFYHFVDCKTRVPTQPGPFKTEQNNSVLTF